MTIEEIKNLLEPYISEPMIHFTVEKQIFLEDDGREVFNKKIRQNIEKRFGVYIWLETTTNEIVYIGMAGKVKTDGTPSDHSVKNVFWHQEVKIKSLKRIYKLMIMFTNIWLKMMLKV